MYVGPVNSSTGKYDPDLIFASKNFRLLNLAFKENVLPLKFWTVESKELADQLGITTAGDIYKVDDGQAHIFLPFSDVMENFSQCHSKILEEALTLPIQVNDPYHF